MTDTPPAAANVVLPLWIERCTSWVAILGGVLAMAMAILVSVSVVGRWLFNLPIEGDFEFVKMGTAIGVFAYLPYTQARRGNIMVDTFTGWMSPTLRRATDAFWDLVFALMMGFCTAGLTFGAFEALKSGETTMQLMIIIWPVIALCACLCALLTITAIATALTVLKARS